MFKTLAVGGAVLLALTACGGAAKKVSAPPITVNGVLALHDSHEAEMTSVHVTLGAT